MIDQTELLKVVLNNTNENILEYVLNNIDYSVAGYWTPVLQFAINNEVSVKKVKQMINKIQVIDGTMIYIIIQSCCGDTYLEILLYLLKLVNLDNFYNYENCLKLCVAKGSSTTMECLEKWKSEHDKRQKNVQDESLNNNKTFEKQINKNINKISEKIIDFVRKEIQNLKFAGSYTGVPDADNSIYKKIEEKVKEKGIYYNCDSNFWKVIIN